MPARRLPLVSASLGAVAWLAYTLTHGGPFALEALYLFAPLVVVPLALSQLAMEHRNGRRLRLLDVLLVAQPVGAAGALASFLVGPGALAGALAGSWLLVTLLSAALGATRFLGRGARPIEELLVDAGLAFLAVGGAWLVASRAGMTPLGFGEPTVLLTAIHFHYAAFAAPLLVGFAGRAILPATRGIEIAYGCVVGGILAGPPLLAAGITLSRALEAAAATVLAASLVLFMVLAWRALARRPGGALVAVASTVALVSMGAALAFAWAHALDVPTMARVHGAANAYGLSALGLIGTLWMAPTPRARRAGMPTSRLRSRRHTGPGFFERERLVDAKRAAPTGLVDDLDAYARADLDTRAVHPEIRAFYEHTAEHALVVAPRWTRGFRGLGRVYARYAVRAGQMCFPFERDGRRVESRILAVRAEADGRESVRAWVRTYVDTGGPAYVAAYATHRERGMTFMNIAFPFPRWNLTSVLRMDALPDGGLVLSTLPPQAGGGDQGVFAVTKRFRLRMPINETIRVWMEGGRVRACHEMRAFGIPFLALDYAITREASGARGGSGEARRPRPTPSASGASGSATGP